MTEYTPSTEEVRSIFVNNPPGVNWHPQREVHRKAFDRWLEQVILEAKQEEWDDLYEETKSLN